MDYKTLYLAHDNRIATITLNRPDKRNAISYELIEDLSSALDQVAKSSALVLILTGAGKAFSRHACLSWNQLDKHVYDARLGWLRGWLKNRSAISRG